MEFRDLNFAHAKLNPAICLLEIFTPPNEDGTGHVTPPQYIRVHGHGWLRELAALLAPYATPIDQSAPSEVVKRFEMIANEACRCPSAGQAVCAPCVADRILRG